MSNLYEISERYSKALAVVDREDFDMIDMTDTLEGIEGEFNDKAINVVKFAQNLVPIADSKRDLAKKLIDEAKALENKHQSMIDYLDTQMRKTDITEIKCDYFTVKYRNNPSSVEVVDIEKVPNDFMKKKVTYAVDKVSSKKALQDGREIAGLKLVTDKQTLVIK